MFKCIAICSVHRILNSGPTVYVHAHIVLEGQFSMGIFCSTRKAFIALLLITLTALTGNVMLIQLSLQQNEAKDMEIKNLNRRLLSVAEEVESDQDFFSIMEQLPEISEHVLFESLQLKNLKIFVYDLPTAFNKDQVTRNFLHPPKIWDPNCTANFYSAEYSLHRFLMKSKYRTLTPSEADFFYVPAYSCCFLINNQPNNLTKTAIFHQKLLNHIRTSYPYFNLSDGRDHIWAFTQGFGPRLFGDFKQISNGIFLVHNGQFTLDDFTPYKDLTIPPDLTGYGFPSVYEIPESSRPAKQWLGHFGGTVIPLNTTDERGSHYSKGVRQYIKEHFTNDPDFRITGTRVKTYIKDMMSSTFCLCPEGWHAWNPRPYQAVQLGCIPVLLSEELELAFEEVIDYSKFMLRVRPADMGKLKSILLSIKPSEIADMQREMEKVWRLFNYGPRGLAPQMILKLLARRKSPHHIKREYHTMQLVVG